MAEHESSDALWEEFVREFEKNNAVHEPSAVERARAKTQPQPQTPERRRGSRWLVPLAVGLVAAAGVAGYLMLPSQPPRHTAAPPVASTSATPSASASASTSASASPLPQATAAVPLSVFPAQVQGYTLVGSTADTNCTGANTVAPPLAGLITQSHGCLGVDLALYKDADGNQYSLALFTMKDPMDAFELAYKLGQNPMDYEVAVQLPPKDSGLKQLPADSGLVQSFASYGHATLVGMAQWSDGRSKDFDKLVNQLTPLTDAVIKRVPA